MNLEGYTVYLAEHKAEIESGSPFILEVMDTDKFEKKVVKAIVAQSPEALPDGQDLWIRDEKAELAPTPWRIKIIQEINGLFTRKPQEPQYG